MSYAVAARMAITDTGRNHIVNATHYVARRRALRAIAVFETVKGAAALVALIGLLDLMHHDVRHFAIELIGRFGLNPDARYPSILLHYADLLPGANVRGLVLLASIYILVRWLEGYGLWNDRVWGEWLAAMSGGLYIPFELWHLVHRTSVMGVAVIAGNVFVVGFLVIQLWHRRKNAPTHQ
jgi:uncharacterized membrane protein (DUF2068 family)